MALPIPIGERGRRYDTIDGTRQIWGNLRPNARQFTFYLNKAGCFRLESDRPAGNLNLQHDP